MAQFSRFALALADQSLQFALLSSHLIFCAIFAPFPEDSVISAGPSFLGHRDLR